MGDTSNYSMVCLVMLSFYVVSSLFCGCSHHTKKGTEANPAITVSQSYNNIIEEGAECLRNKNLEQARESFQQAITVNPEYPNAYYNIGLVYVQETNFSEAISWFNTALEKNPDFAKSHLALGSINNRINNKTEAKKHFSTYLKLAPNTSYSESVKTWLENQE